jgi:tRNA nucleotidyltransferase (CCA-adding enzyme)
MVEGAPVAASEDLLARVRALPCGARLLDAAAGRRGVHLVGGAVRDLLLGREPAELDVVVEGDPEPVAAALGGAHVTHDRFGTWSVVADGCRYDLAMARAEAYARPGALPDVRPAGIEEDLGRRDVTVNALALDLADGTLRGAPGALEDLEAGVLRVLHPRSFVDDPTRLWRLARYRGRLGFAVEPQTAALAREAVRSGALRTVSGPRLGNELRLALAEPDPVAALRAAVELGLAPWLEPDPERVERALGLLPQDGRREVAVLAAAVVPRAAEVVGTLGLPADWVRAVADAAALRPRARELVGARPSEVARLLERLAVEAAAAVGAEGPEEEVRRFLERDRHVRLHVGGEDLIAAGVPRGPEVGRRLRAVRDRVLDGEVQPGRERELVAALAL